MDHRFPLLNHGCRGVTPLLGMGKAHEFIPFMGDRRSRGWLPLFRWLALLLFAGFSLQSFAGASALMNAVPSASISAASGVRAVTGTVTATAGSFHIPSVVNVAGRSVTMQAVARIASNAPSYVRGAARTRNPGVVAASILAWLALDYLTDQGGTWMHGAPTISYRVVKLVDNGVEYATAQALLTAISAQYVCKSVNSVAAGCNDPNFLHTNSNPGVATVGASIEFQAYPTQSPPWVVISRNGIARCPGGYSTGASSCTPIFAPATDTDWATAVAPMPDAVAVDAAAQNMPVPVDEPALDPAPVTSPISDPYVDPVTNKTVQDKVQITPAPVPGNPFQVRVTPFTVETQTDGSTVNKPADLPSGAIPPATPPPSQTDCDKFPNSSGCSEFGDVPDVNLQTQDRGTSITPQSGWGVSTASCPADVVLHGKRFSYASACTSANMARPLVLAMAWLAAAFILMSGVKES